MPTLIKMLTPDGLKPVPYQADSLAEAARYEPHDGVYTITNTYEATKVLKLDAHLDRLENSARLAGTSEAQRRAQAVQPLQASRCICDSHCCCSVL